MKTLLRALALLGITAVAVPARAQMGDPTKVTVKTTPVTGGISMIEGANGFAGGNVAVSVGDDGVFIIDDEIEPMTAKLKTALGALSKRPVRFVVNTHWHMDHTGGNPALAAAGAVIIAQENVRKRLGVDAVLRLGGQEMKIKAQPPAALPVVTGYPIVDVDSGGQFAGFIAAADKILALANDQTKIIPGHGPLMTKADVVAYRQMLIEVRDKVGKLIAGKKSADEIKAAKPLADLDAKWGQGFVKADFVIDAVVKTHPAPAAPPKGKGKHKAAQ